MAESTTTEPETIAPATPSQVESSISQAEAIEWIGNEFSAWTVTVDTTSGWNGQRKDLWEAHQIGHHSQRALTPGKLYRRLDEYEARIRERGALADKVVR